jgi:minor extracellular serine protease Vpr
MRSNLTLRMLTFRVLAALVASALLTSFPSRTQARGQQQQRHESPPYPDIRQGRGRDMRGDEPTDKLTPELRALYDQLTPSRGGPEPTAFSAAQLKELFDVKADDPNPYVGVAVKLEPGAGVAELKRAGAKVYLRSGDTVYADVRVSALGSVAEQQSVLSVNSVKAKSAPPLPKQTAPPAPELPAGAGAGAKAATTPALDNQFNAAGLTGKGVIVGVVDSGIDWRHEDFIRPDGTTRVLFLWDMTDDSFDKSGGRVGGGPPLLADGGERGPGTVYTDEQINAALRGRGVVNSTDNFGHGTASAGTAAGNGRATANGVPAGTFRGVAPEADLVVVKVGDCGGLKGAYVLGTVWIARLARALKRPVVINHSLGTQLTSHAGDEFEERVMNELTGAGKPGVAITVSAGNEGAYSLHAGGRFGPRREGQKDIRSAPVELFVSPERTERVTWLNAYFRTEDEWGLLVRGSGGFLVDEKGAPLLCYVFKAGGEVKVQLQPGAKKPDYFDNFAEAVLKYAALASQGESFDRVNVPLPPGSYQLWAFGATGKVSRGTFDFYLPFYNQAAFTFGGDKRQMVGSPGNAANVITVGAYDFRENWPALDGTQVIYNLRLGDISGYSNPGGPKAGGGYKPDIAAPATYTVSPLSHSASPEGSGCGGENMRAGLGPDSVTRDGRHIAWSGTSAAAPYAAGVVALMFEKNPSLDAAQIKGILTKTATKGDALVGAVPNPEWGYGKLNPAAAIAATPLPPAARRPRR